MLPFPCLLISPLRIAWLLKIANLLERSVTPLWSLLTMAGDDSIGPLIDSEPFGGSMELIQSVTILMKFIAATGQPALNFAFANLAVRRYGLACPKKRQPKSLTYLAHRLPRTVS